MGSLHRKSSKRYWRMSSRSKGLDDQKAGFSRPCQGLVRNPCPFPPQLLDLLLRSLNLVVAWHVGNSAGYYLKVHCPRRPVLNLCAGWEGTWPCQTAVEDWRTCYSCLPMDLRPSYATAFHGECIMTYIQCYQDNLLAGMMLACVAYERGNVLVDRPSPG